MPSSTTPGSSTSISSRAAMSTRPSPRIERLGTPKTPANPFRAGDAFGASWFTHICYGLPDCSPPCMDLTSFPANGGLYFQAFDGSVTLPTAGYDYSIDWTPMLTGLSPAGLTASLAAPTPSSWRTRTPYSLPVSRRTDTRPGTMAGTLWWSWLSVWTRSGTCCGSGSRRHQPRGGRRGCGLNDPP